MKIETRFVGQNEPDDLEGQEVKVFVPSNSFYIFTRLEILLGVKLSGHTDTLTLHSNLIEDLYKRGEISNEQQHLNALYKFRNN